MFPEIKRKISEFFKDESGSISKQSAFAIGSFLGSAAISTVIISDKALSANEKIQLSYELDGTKAVIRGEHTHHSQHGNHSSHSSHSSAPAHSDGGACYNCNYVVYYASHGSHVNIQWRDNNNDDTTNAGDCFFNCF